MNEQSSPNVDLAPDAVATVTEDSKNTQANQNISILENSNVPTEIPLSENSELVKWEGDPRYFQTGKKKGQLKPSAAVSGLDAESPTAFEGLDAGALKASAKKVVPADKNLETKKAIKSEKKLVEARVGAKMVMRLLDTMTGWISRGQYGADFTPQQAKERNDYRDALENDWNDYLLTLDIPMHPALVVAFGSCTYVAAAFNTPAGQIRSATLKEKVVSKAVGLFFKSRT